MNSRSFILFILIFFATISQLSAQLSPWQFHKPITIIEQSGKSLDDYQTLLILNTQSLILSGKMNSDGDDIRFVLNCSDTIFLHYWIETDLNTDSTKIWVKIPSIPLSDSTIIYLLYGNSSALAMSNVDSVMDLYDHFDSVSTAFSLECSAPTDSFVGSSIHLSWVGAGVYSSNRTFPDSIAYKAEVMVDNCSGRWPGIFWKLMSNGGGYSLLSDGNVPDIRIGVTAGQGWCDGENWASSLFNYSNPKGIWQHSWVSTGDIESYFPNVGKITSGNSFFPKSGDLKFCFGGIQGGIGHIQIDWVRIRKYASVEPTILIGSEFGTLTAEFLFAINGHDISFTDSSLNANKYSWDFGDGNIDSIANPTHTFDSIGLYNVCLISSNACFSDTICKIVEVISSINEHPNSNINIDIYPNPANKQLNIDINANHNLNYEIEIVNSFGIKQFGVKVDGKANFALEIDLSGISPGIYFIKIVPYGVVKKLVIF